MIIFFALAREPLIQWCGINWNKIRCSSEAAESPREEYYPGTRAGVKLLASFPKHISKRVTDPDQGRRLGMQATLV